MTGKRVIGAAVALGFALALGACSPFSGYVSDNWPHWAGGEPTGLPPRPGMPGYAEYTAHGQPVQNPEAAAGATQSPPPVETTQAVSQTPAGTVQRTSIFGGPQVAAPRPSVPPTAQPAAQPPPASGGASDDGSIVRGGLY
jgi:hypothetical protein